MCEASVAVDDSSQDVKEMLSSTKQTADLGFVLSSLRRMKSILGFFNKTSNDTEADVLKTPRSRRRKERREAQQNGDANTAEEKKVTPTPTGNKMDSPSKQENGVGVHAKVQTTKETR